MDDEIIRLYYSNEPIDDLGREFLANRNLDIPEAFKAGICSKDGFIYFLFFRNGDPIRWKARSIDDKKKQFFSKLNSKDQHDFQMPFFCQFKGSTIDYLIITEGEFDCVALRGLKALNCVSLPNGSGSVESSFKANYDFLQQFREIYIAFDMDKSGDEASLKALSMLNPEKFRRIKFPCKDANEWVLQNPYLEFSDLRLLMDNAEIVKDECGVDSTKFGEDFRRAISLGVGSGWNSLDKVLGGIRLGELTVVTADTGSGKSTFCLNLMKNLAMQHFPVWINSYEMDPNIVNRKLMSCFLHKSFKYSEISENDWKLYCDTMRQKKVLINCSNKKIDLAILRNQIEKFSLAYGVKYILLDHLDYIHCNGKNKTALENIDEAMREVHAMAMEFKVGIILVVHPKQLRSGDDVTMSDLKGSAAIKQYADNIIIIKRMNRNDPTDPDRVMLKVCKNRLVGKECSFYLNYVPEYDGYEERYVIPE